MSGLEQRKAWHGFKVVRSAVLMIGVGGFSGLLMLLVHVVVGRLMGEVEYALLVALLGLLFVLSVPAVAIQIAVARYVSEYAHGDDQVLWVSLVRKLSKRIALFGSISFLCWCAASGFVAEQLHASSATSLIVLGMVALIGLYNPVVVGALQGCRRFGWLAANQLTPAATRLLFSTVIVLLGGGVTAVLGGVAGGMFCAVMVGFFPIRKVLFQASNLADFDMRPLTRFFWPVMIGQAICQLMMNLDIIFSARFLSGADLAAYGKAAMLARTVLFLPLPIVMVMFPYAVVSTRRRVVAFALGSSFLISGSAALFVTFFPAIPMKLMYGVDTPLYLELVRLYVWAAIPLSLSLILVQYLWARHYPLKIFWLLPVAGIYAVALFRFHATPQQMIACLGTCTASMFLVLAGITVCLRKK